MAETPEDLLFERAQQNPKLALVVQSARDFAALVQDPAWEWLKGAFRDQRAGYGLTLASRLMGGEDVPRDEILARRWFFQGVRAVLEHPEKTLESLEKAATAAWNDAQSQGEEPY